MQEMVVVTGCTKGRCHRNIRTETPREAFIRRERELTEIRKTMAAPKQPYSHMLPRPSR